MGSLRQIYECCWVLHSSIYTASSAGFPLHFVTLHFSPLHYARIYRVPYLLLRTQPLSLYATLYIRLHFITFAASLHCVPFIVRGALLGLTVGQRPSPAPTPEIAPLLSTILKVKPSILRFKVYFSFIIVNRTLYVFFCYVFSFGRCESLAANNRLLIFTFFCLRRPFFERESSRCDRQR